MPSYKQKWQRLLNNQDSINRSAELRSRNKYLTEHLAKTSIALHKHRREKEELRAIVEQYIENQDQDKCCFSDLLERIAKYLEIQDLPRELTRETSEGFYCREIYGIKVNGK